ncbi:MAG: MFS transporter [Porphyromonadaceae bacterium]|nr:MFS transporter [Porphyromonadaceae bacterium]
MPWIIRRQGGSVLPILLVLYVAQSLPMAFFSTILPIVLRQESYSLTQITLLQLIKLPWILKFVWAPWVDRQTTTPSSLRRMIVVSEIVYALLILGLSFLNLEAQLIPIFVCMLLSFVASSVQDIAVDKFAICSLKSKRRSLGNAMQSGGNFLGSLVGSGLIVALYYYAGWRVSVLLLASIALIVLIPFVLWSREASKVDEMMARVSLQDEQPSAVRLIMSYYKSIPCRRYFVGLMLYFAPIMPLMVLIKPLLIDWGLGVQTVAMLLGVWGSAVAALASFVGGQLMRRLSSLVSLRLIYTLTVVVSFFLAFIARQDPSIPLIFLGIAGLWSVYALSNVYLYTMSMGHVRKGSEGTDFTLQTIVAQLGGMLFSAGVGGWGDALGYPVVFGTIAIFALLLSLISPRLLCLIET